jgi:hypothetical protein
MTVSVNLLVSDKIQKKAMAPVGSRLINEKKKKKKKKKNLPSPNTEVIRLTKDHIIVYARVRKGLEAQTILARHALGLAV